MQSKRCDDIRPSDKYRIADCLYRSGNRRGSSWAEVYPDCLCSSRGAQRYRPATCPHDGRKNGKKTCRHFIGSIAQNVCECPDDIIRGNNDVRNY